MLAAATQVPAQAALLDNLARHDIGLLRRVDVAYPEALTERLPEERLPYCFFYRGDLTVLTQPGLAILGGQSPSPGARRTTEELSRALAGDGHHLVGGYGRGIDRLALDTACGEKANTTLMLPLGIQRFAEQLDMLSEPLDEGRMLVLSPFAPEVPYRDALAEARLSLVAALSEATFLIAPDRGPRGWPAVAALLQTGRELLAWLGSDDAHTPAWLQAGATAFDDAASGRLRLLEWLGAAPATLGADEGNAITAPGDSPLPFADAESAIDALSRSGTVPDALARRLREARWPSETE